jgi:hypothetical protein
VGREKIKGKSEGRCIWYKYYILIYEKGKMMLVGTVLRRGDGG